MEWQIGILAAILVANSGMAQERPLPPLERPESKVAPRLPAEFRDAPRISVAALGSAPVQALPLTFRLRARGLESCYETAFRGDRPEAAHMAFPGEEARKISVLQLGRDAARRVRYLFFDGGDNGSRKALVLDERAARQSVVSFSFGEVQIAASPDASCEKVAASAPIGRNKPWHEGDGPNAGSVFARVQIREESGRTVWGWCLAEGYGGASTHGALRNPSGGATQEWNLYSYVPEDGRSVALVLAMSKDWTDPRDGRVYRYVQLASGEFVKLAKEGATAFRLDAGPAVPRPIEVTVFAEEEWVGCASRAALRN